MTLAPVAWYVEYAETTELWGWSPLEDQQMAGLIMWMPACLPYLVAAVWLFARSIWQPETGQLAHRLPSTSTAVFS
jgi:putative membrane protein